MDIKGFPKDVFIPNGRNIGSIEYRFGGVARNVADDLAGMGYRPVFVSMADADGQDVSLVGALQDAGVDTTYILKDKNGVGTWMAIFNTEGDVYANISKRQDLRKLESFLEENAEAIFNRADGVLLEMDIQNEIVSKVFDIASRIHVPVYGVISNITEALERMEYIKRTACFICNAQEAGVLFDTDEFNTVDSSEEQGSGCNTNKNLARILRQHKERIGIPSIVVTIGKDGAVYADEQGSCGFCPAEKVQVLDTTGAGDSFFAGTAAGLISGQGLELSCSIGTQVAAKVIQTTENVFRK